MIRLETVEMQPPQPGIRERSSQYLLAVRLNRPLIFSNRLISTTLPSFAFIYENAEH